MLISDMQVANKILSEHYLGVKNSTANYCCNIRHAIKILEKLNKVEIRFNGKRYTATCISDGARTTVSESDFPMLIAKISLKRLGYICNF